MGIFDGILGAVGSVLGFVGQEHTNDTNVEIANSSNAFNAEQAGLGREFNAFQADTTRNLAVNMMNQQQNFQERMANTGFQRGVADMEAAGLNPMLAYTHGQAATPFGAGGQAPGSSGSPVATAAVPRVENSMAAGMNTGFAAATIGANIDKIKAEADESRSRALVNAASIPKIEQDIKTGTASAGHLSEQERDLAERRRVLMPEEHSRLVSETFQRNEEARLAQRRESTEEQRAQLYRLESAHSSLGLQRARNESEFQHDWWARVVSPYLPDVLKGSSSAYGFSRMMGR